ncbi:hypothetical protein GF402_08865 [Candidatus Fermentibacteria bacterium]|nr:hypothetical protein [Candidatus Fermentibacteria bacterium]
MIRALALLFVLLCTGLTAQPRVTVLDNGLRVVTEELHYAPVVASVITYRVGGRNETDTCLGMSHFCEHLMFKGTPSMPKARFWQIVKRDGGWANAFTSSDVTTYYLALPAERLEDALAIESDRMINCTLDSAEVIAERNVVMEERRMRSVDSPSGALYEALGETAFTVHPYGKPLIGYDRDIQEYDYRKARCYYDTYYDPSNAVLALVGDFETEEVLAEVEDYFGDIETGGKPPEPGVTEPPQTAPRRVKITHRSNLPRVAVAFHTPPGSHPDTPVLSMISTYLSGGRSSWLEQELVRTGLATSAWAHNDGGIDPGLFVISAVLDREGNPEEVERRIMEELEELRKTELSPAVVDELRNRTRASMVLSRSSPLYKALMMAMNTAMFDDPLKSEKNVAALDTVTASHIREVAGRYFRPCAVTVVVLEPEGGAPSGTREREELPTDIQEPTSIDYEGLEIPPDLLTPPRTSVSEGVASDTLENGLQVYVLEDHTFPVVSVRFAVPMSSLREPPELAGLAGVITETMMRGTRELSYGEFHRRLESEGGSLSFSTGNEYSYGSVRLLSEDLDVALLTAADLLQEPAFREEDFRRVIEEAMADVARRRESAFSMAFVNLSRIIASRPEMARVSTEETLGRIEVTDAFTFYQRCVRPEGSYLVVVGDVDPDTVFLFAEEAFGDWQNPKCELPPPRYPGLSPLTGDTLVHTMSGRVQAALLIGTDCPGYESNDYEAFSVMNSILGSGIGSRLGHYVRDDQGLAYVVGSYPMSLRTEGYYQAYLSTRVDYVPRAMESVLQEIGRMTREEVLEVELNLVKSSQVGRHATDNMTYSSLSDYLLNKLLTGRPLDYDLIRLQRILRLRPSEVRAVAERYLTPRGWFVSVAGGVDENLQPLGP